MTIVEPALEPTRPVHPAPTGPPEKATIAVIAEEDFLAEQITSRLGLRGRLHNQPWRRGHEPLSPNLIVDALVAARAGVVCIGPDVPIETAFAVSSIADRDHSHMSVVLVTAPTQDLWRDALRAGVRDVIDVRRIDEELEPALKMAFDRLARHSHQPTVEPPATTGRVIVVVSPKGGSGKTVVASNLAAQLAVLTSGSVALVDLDVQFGDVAPAFGLLPEHTIGELATVPSIDSTTLKVFLTRHESSGAFVLCGADSPEDGEAVTHEHAARIIELLAEDFTHVVVDTPAGLDERTLAALEQATDIVCVATTDVSSVRNLGKEITALDRLGLVSARRHFVLNRADARVGIDVADIERALAMPIDAAVPSSRAVPISMNRGCPIVVDAPTSRVARELMKLAERVQGDDENGSRPNWFQRRRK